MKNIFKSTASPVILRRLAEYLCLLSKLPGKKVTQISSSQLAHMMGTNSSQLRQDFHHFGGFGKPGHPYDVHILKDELQDIFGVNEPVNLLLAGATPIAEALVENRTMQLLNIQILGIVDPDPHKQGMVIDRFTVMKPDDLDEFLKRERIQVGAICTAEPEPSLTLLLKNGIKGIWNLSLEHVRPPKGVVVKNENLAAGLLTLIYNLKH